LKYGNYYGKKIKPLLVSKEESIDVDDSFDLFLVQLILKNWNSYKKKISR
jgi:hypothetical protein